MTSPPMNGPSGNSEQRKSALASRIGRQEQHLLEEFARLMGTEVSAVRLFDGAAGLDRARPSRPRLSRAIAMEQIATQGNKELHSVGEAGAASTEASPEDLAPEGGAIVARRKSGRATLMLGAVFAIGVAGVIGAWALKIAPGVRPTPLIDMAGDELSKAAPPLQDAASSSDRTAAILPAGQAGEPNLASPASNVEHPTELQQSDKSRLAASLAAASPESSDGAIAMSSVPVIRSITPTDALHVPATTAGQTDASAGAPEFLPDPKQAKAGLFSGAGPVAAEDSESVTDAKRSPRLAEAPVLTSPSNAPPQPAHPPVPLARRSFSSSTSGAPQPAAHKIGAPPKSSSKSIDHAPNPKVGAAIGTSSPPLDLVTAPGAATAPVVTKASNETSTSTESLLQFVPNLFEKGVSAVRGFVRDAGRGS